MGLLILPLNCWKSTKYAKNFEKLLTGNCPEFFFINLQLILYLIVESQVVLGRIMYSIIDPIGVCLFGGGGCV